MGQGEQGPQVDQTGTGQGEQGDGPACLVGGGSDHLEEDIQCEGDAPQERQHVLQ